MGLFDMIRDQFVAFAFPAFPEASSEGIRMTALVQSFERQGFKPVYLFNEAPTPGKYDVRLMDQLLDAVARDHDVAPTVAAGRRLPGQYVPSAAITGANTSQPEEGRPLIVVRRDGESVAQAFGRLLPAEAAEKVAFVVTPYRANDRQIYLDARHAFPQARVVVETTVLSDKLRNDRLGHTFDDYGVRRGGPTPEYFDIQPGNLAQADHALVVDASTQTKLTGPLNDTIAGRAGLDSSLTAIMKEGKLSLIQYAGVNRIRMVTEADKLTAEQRDALDAPLAKGLGYEFHSAVERAALDRGIDATEAYANSGMDATDIAAIEAYANDGSISAPSGPAAGMGL